MIIKTTKETLKIINYKNSIQSKSKLKIIHLTTESRSDLQSKRGIKESSLVNYVIDSIKNIKQDKDKNAAKYGLFDIAVARFKKSMNEVLMATIDAVV